MKREIQSFRAAFKGLLELWIKERHGRFHLLATVLALAGGFACGLQTFEWIAVLLCIALVNGLEALNSALEKTLDLLHPDTHPAVGRAKDLAAGAVLVAAIVAAVVGLLVFGPYVTEAMGL
ncbi:MAG: diacylglycerol kinase family protein [Flavobacteriales bacterium]|nr:diacylglycerol kinase family protein [Flavobacteriales bacterium]